MAIDWSLARQPNMLAQWMDAYDEGKKMRREEATRNALATVLGGGFGTSPTSPTGGMGAPGLPPMPTGHTPGIGDGIPGNRRTDGGFNPLGGEPMGGSDDKSEAWKTIYQNSPELGLKLQSQIAERDDKANRARLIPLAANGDKDAMLALIGVDYQTAKGLQDWQKDAAIGATQYIGDAAFDIITRPEAERAAAWDAYVDAGVAKFPGLAQYKGKYSPEGLNSLVAQAGQMKEFMAFQQPKFVPVGEGGLQGFQYGVPIQDGGQAPQQPQQPAPQAPQANPQEAATAALRGASSRGYVLPEEEAAIKAGLRPDGAGQAAYEGWLKNNGIKRVTRTGTAPDGRKVVQLEDGTTQYAD